MKFKLFWVKFIFNLNVVFTLNFLKMLLSRVRFSPGFLQEQDFPESNLITADNMGKNRVFADRVANLVDFSPIKANLSLLKNVFGIFKTNIWTFKVF
jgi:hypothetical protein